METLLRVLRAPAVPVLETFLGGMETCLPRPATNGSAAPLKPSLVEWKQWFQLVVRHREIHLETFLGGMETAPPVTLSLCSGSLETFLGGMETSHSFMDRYGWHALKPSLVEWKPRRQRAIFDDLYTLKPSLVEWKQRLPDSATGVAVSP